MNQLVDDRVRLWQSVRSCAEKIWACREHIPNPALMDGKAGMSLFFGHLYLLSGEERDYERFSQLFEQTMEELSLMTDADPTLSRGLTGWLWVLEHFTQMGLLNPIPKKTLSRLQERVALSIPLDGASHHYDLLHGLLGKGMYFLECYPNAPSASILKQLVDLLEHFAIQDQGKCTWIDHHGDRSKFNLGMAHGVPSIIAFLSKVHRKNIAPSQTQFMLDGAVEWLLGQQRPIGRSLYPVYSHSTSESRLAWCYGDLGPALALFHASQALHRRDWLQAALDLAKRASQREKEEAGLLKDPVRANWDTGFCHGTSGVAHIFHRFYQASGWQEFKRKAEYWLTLTINATLSMEQKAETPLERVNAHSSPSYGLLEGMAGVGLVLSSFIQSPPLPWDSIFQTDIASIT